MPGADNLREPIHPHEVTASAPNEEAAYDQLTILLKQQIQQMLDET